MRLVLVILLASTLALAKPTCADALNACDLVINEQNLSIDNLKTNQKRLEDAVVTAENEGDVMKWFYLGLGVLTGFGVGYLTVSRH